MYYKKFLFEFLVDDNRVCIIKNLVYYRIIVYLMGIWWVVFLGCRIRICWGIWGECCGFG